MSVFVVSYAPGFYAVPPWGSTLYTGEGRFQGESIYLCQVIQILWLGACISWVFVLFVVVYVHLSLYLYLMHQDQPGPVRACAVRPRSAMVGSARLQLTARTASTRIRDQHPRSVNSWWEHKRVRVKWGLVVGLWGIGGECEKGVREGGWEGTAGDWRMWE